MGASGLVSVVVTTYNRVGLMPRAIASVLAQTYGNLECIIVDDRSQDGTLDRLLQLSRTDERIRIISHIENRHLSAARNTGILAAQGDFVAFLDDDDVWLPTKLEKQVGLLAAAPPSVGLVYCWLDVCRERELISTRRPTLRGDVFQNVILSQPLGNGSTLLVRSEVVRHLGLFDENLRRGIDGDFIRRIAEHYEVEVVPEVLVHYFVDHGGHQRITSSNRESILNAIRGDEVKLVKFRHALAQRPVLHAALLAKIARLYARVGELQRAYSNIREAHRINPRNVNVYVQAARVVAEFLFRRAPRSAN